jgi:GT2 family glycosyltransferase
MTRVSIVILNWNGIDFLKRFIPSVLEYSSGKDMALWIADNGSTDGSAGFLKERYPEINLLEFDLNYGFAGGYNRALSLIESEYFILLNSDVEVTPGWTEPMLKIMESDPEVAACMPKIRDLNRREYFEYAGASGGFMDFMGYPFCRGRIFDLVEEDKGQYDEEREVFWATGACMMVRAADWHSLRGFDDRFFAHMEEIDLCWKLKNAGKKIMVCPTSVVYHLGGGTLSRDNPRKTWFNFRNSLLMLLKNLPAGKLYLVLLRMVFDWLSMIKYIVSFSFANAFAIFRAHISFFGLVPLYLRERMRRQASIRSLKHKEIYPESIVINFFVRGRKHFSQLY